MLQRYAVFLGGATHEYIIGESLKRLFRRDKEFNDWLAKTIHSATTKEDAGTATLPSAKAAQRHTSSAA